VEALLEDGDVRVRAEAAAGLIRCGGEAGVRRAWPVLMAMVAAPEVETRIWGARALGQAASPLLKEDVRGPLLALLRDDALAVRVAALKSTEDISCPEAIPLIVRMLGEDRAYEAAAHALVAHGDESLEALRQTAAPDPSGRLGRAALRVPEVLGRIGSLAAFKALRELLHARSDGLRHAAIDAICHLVRARPALRAEIPDLQDLLLAEIGRALVLQSLQDDFRWLKNADLLKDTLNEMREGCLRRVFVLLGVLLPQTDMEAIRRAVMKGTPEVRANAVEVLDNLLKGEVHDRLMGPLLEPFDPSEGSVENATARLRALMEWNDGWLQACALHAAGRGGLAETLPEVEAAADSPDALVRETALWAKTQIHQKN
jgi:HEAT repeat protein